MALRHQFFTQTTFAMRRPRLKADFYADFSKGLPATIPAAIGLIQDNYHFSLIQCTIEALGGKIEHTEVYSTENKLGYNTIFTRDFGIVLYDKKLLIVPDQKFEVIHNARNILLKFVQDYQFKLITVENTFFEGGNVVYSPRKKIIFHGTNCHPRASFEAQVEKNLEATLKPYDIGVVGIKLSDEILAQAQLRKEYFYHLDLFIHLVLDEKNNERVVILNKKILAPESQKLLEKLFGNDLIDLQYKGYLSAPCKLNMVEVEGPEGKHFVCPSLPESLILKLKEQGVNVITPQMLNSRSKFFNPLLAKTVCKKLLARGFLNVEEKTLTTQVPVTFSPFYCDGGTPLPINFAFRYFPIPLPEKGFTFEMHDGGPHCFTLEVNKQLCSFQKVLEHEKRSEYVASYPPSRPFPLTRQAEMDESDCCKMMVTCCLTNTLGFFKKVMSTFSSGPRNDENLRIKKS